MSKFRSTILIIGLLSIAVAASLLTVLILYATGTIVTDPIELVYNVERKSKDYDGTPLTLSEDDYSLVSGEILEGHTAQVKLIGSQTNAGESESTLEVKIVDKNGFDVSNQYAVKVNTGTLTVEKQKISVSIPDGQEAVYNGKEIFFNKYDVQGELAKGHKIAGTNAYGINAGPLSVGLEPIIYDAFDNDVTENYEIAFEAGEVEITRRPLTVKPKNVSKVYDGTPLTAEEYEIVSGSLAPGQTIEYTIVNEAGREFSSVDCTEDLRIKFGTFVIRDEDKNDVTANYDCNYQDRAIFKIEKRPITIATATRIFTYDGDAHYDDTIQILSGTLAPNQIFTVTEATAVTTVADGEKPNVLTIAFTTKDGDPVNESNYDITDIKGKISVKPFDLTVYTKSYTKVYDGKPLGDIMGETNYELSVKLAEKFTVTAACDDAVKEQVDAITETAYSVKNVSITVEGGDDKPLNENFNINVREGKYSITKKSLTLSPSTELKGTYNGNTYEFKNEDVFKGINLDDYGISADDFEIVSFYEIKNAGTHYYSANFTGDSNNYDISVSQGKVTIARKDVELKTNVTTVNMDYRGYESYYSDDANLINNLNVDGHKVKTAVFNKQLESIKVVSVTVYDDIEGDLTANYNITYGVTITVVVKPCELNLILGDYTPLYYRVVKADIAKCVRAEGLAEGDKLVVDEDDVDTYSTTYSIQGYKIMHGDKDVTDYYTKPDLSELSGNIIMN